VLAWYAAVADGWSAQDALYASGPGQTVRKSDLAGVLRAEVAPPAFTEQHKSDSHLGVGRHLVLGATLVTQQGISYQRRGASDPGGSEDRLLWGVDLSGHVGPFTAQAEWYEWKVESTTRGTVKPRGMYVQAGVYLPYGLEPAARFEHFTEDVGRPESRQLIFTGGLNWYLMGHGLKVQANYVHKALDRGATGWLPAQDKVNLYQLQLQLYL
jgi:phosphate-selective porin